MAVFRNLATHAFSKVAILLSTDSKGTASPTITAGSGAPSATEPNGSLYLRTDASTADDSLYQRVGGSWVIVYGQTA